MSVVNCIECNAYVDTDFECFDFELGLCEECQERKYNETRPRPGPTLGIQRGVEDARTATGTKNDRRKESKMSTELAVFNEVKAEIEKYKIENKKLVFDYGTMDGEKQARSHIFKVRKTKKIVTDIHKTGKAKAKAVCDAYDKEKRDLLADIEEMIDYHDAPLREIEQRKIAAALKKLEEEKAEQKRIDDEKLAELERRETEAKAKEAELKEKEDAINAEANRIQQQKDIEEAKRVAAEEAKKQAEQDAINAANQAEIDKHRAISDAIEAEKEKARKLERKLASEEAARIKEVDRLAEEEHKRQANVEHRMDYNNLALSGFNKITNDSVVSRNIVEVIVKGEIPNITMNY